MTDITPPEGHERPGSGAQPSPDPRIRNMQIGLGIASAVAVLALIALIVVLATRDDDTVATGPSTTTTTVIPTTSAFPPPTTSAATTTTSTTTTTTTTEATTTTSTTTTTTVPEVDTSTAVFPTSRSTDRYADPVRLAEAFAVDFLGMRDPVVSEFRSGDSRSGEVGVRPVADGPETTLFVRILGDGSWWVLGAATENITIDQPRALDTVTSVMRLTGQALAFEGTVTVEVRADDVSQPLADTFVTGGGTEKLPFAGEVTFNPGDATRGSLVLFEESAEDGSTWAAAVIRIAFG